MRISRVLILERCFLTYLQEFELQHDKTNKMISVPSDDSDQPGNLPSLIRVFTLRSMDS